MTDQIKPWWDTYPKVVSDHLGLSNWCWFSITSNALTGGPPLRTASIEVFLKTSRDDFIRELVGLNFRVVVYSGHKSAPLISTSLAHPHGYVDTAFNTTNRSVRVNVWANDQQLYDNLFAVVERCTSKSQGRGLVYTLAKGSFGGYQTIPVGMHGASLVRDNYDVKVLDSYDHVVEDMSAKSPCGRLVVVSGEPGSGKSFLVRGLIEDVDSARFVLIPPDLITYLGSPEMIPSLTTIKADIDGPLVLLCEDGDMCLVPRGTDNMATISAVLNFGDGILGDSLNARVIVTTNAPRISMDKAALRDGRLCAHVNVDSLSAAKASAVLKRLVPETEKKFDSPTVLAKVYATARDLKERTT